MPASPKSRHSADATRCVHAGEDRHGRFAPLTTEIAQASVFTVPNVKALRRYAEGRSAAYLYTRYANPTTAAAEQKIAALEGGEECVVTASGQAATLGAVLAACRSGDQLVSMLDVYGGTLHLFEEVLPRFGIRTKLLPYSEMSRLERHLTRRTRLLYLETPTNPTLRCVDIQALCRLAHRAKVRVVVDNTFATPILQKPLALGADAVMHSGTKYLGGHSDLTAGALVGPRAFIREARRVKVLTGGVLDPGASYLLLRGLKTLELRVERACDNAMKIARPLARHPKVARVMYPGLESHEAHALARRQMRAFGMMMSIELAGKNAKRRAASAERFIDGLKLWYLATSLGGVESTVSYPVLASHVGMSAQRLRLMDVSPATVRLSVGIEDAADLIADLEQALSRA